MCRVVDSENTSVDDVHVEMDVDAVHTLARRGEDARHQGRHAMAIDLVDRHQQYPVLVECALVIDRGVLDAHQDGVLQTGAVQIRRRRQQLFDVTV